MAFGEGCGSGRGEFDMLMQENAVRRRKGGGEESLRAGRVGLLGKWLWQEERQPGPGLRKEKCVCARWEFCICEDKIQF